MSNTWHSPRTFLTLRKQAPQVWTLHRQLNRQFLKDRGLWVWNGLHGIHLDNQHALDHNQTSLNLLFGGHIALKEMSLSQFYVEYILREVLLYSSKITVVQGFFFGPFPVSFVTRFALHYLSLLFISTLHYLAPLCHIFLFFFKYFPLSFHTFSQLC